MRSKLHHNAIFTSYCNSFCLVCDCYLDSDDLALQHIDLHEHELNLLTFPYVKKYENDNIRMVKYGYFCEFCNKLLSTPSKISVHVGKTDHYENKCSSLFQRVNGAIIAFDKLVIDEKSWHSITDSACAICNEDVVDAAEHIEDLSHLLRLVQSKVELKDNGIYRMTEDARFHCLTCNIILSNTTMEEHFNGSDHQRLWKACEKVVDTGGIPKNDANNTETLMQVEENKKQPKKSRAKENCYICESHASDNGDGASNLIEKGSIDAKSSKENAILSSIHFENEGIQAKAIKNKDAFKPIKLDTYIKDPPQSHIDEDDSSNDIPFLEDIAVSEENNDLACNTNYIPKKYKHLERLYRDCAAGVLNVCSQYEDAESNAILFKNEFDSTKDKENKKYATKSQKDASGLWPHKSSHKDETKFGSELMADAAEDHNKIQNNNNETDNYNILINPQFDEVQVKQDELRQNQLQHISQATPETMSTLEKVYRTAKLPYIEAFGRYANTPTMLVLRNHMTVVKEGTAFCKLCFVKVQFKVQDLWLHIFSRKHRIVETQCKNNNLNSYLYQFSPTRVYIPFKMRMIDYIYNTLVITRNFDVVLNSTYCISRNSCILVYNITERDMLCHLCDLKKPFQNPEVHLSNSVKHVRLMNLSLVITELREEFVRELSPTKYHCGFCNITVPSLRDVMDHLRGTMHKEKKIDAYNRLHEHVPLPGQLEALSNIIQGIPFIPNWADRNPPGFY